MTDSGDGDALAGQAVGEGEALLSERLCWLREARGELAGLLAAEEARLEHFQATAHANEEKLLKRVKLTYEAERRRADEHHHALANPLRHQLGTIEHQLERLETLADAIIATSESPSVKETERLLTEELPLPTPPPSSSMLQEAWERVCPLPHWRLTCDVLTELSKPPDRSKHLGESRIPQWPLAERADFKGGTSLPLPWVDSESSGPEEMVAGRRATAARSFRARRPVLPVTRSARLYGDVSYSDDMVDGMADSATSEQSSGHSGEFGGFGNHGRGQRPSDSNDDMHEHSGRQDGFGQEPHSRQMSANWLKKWLDSNQLCDLIETTAELDAIRQLERRRSVARAKRRISLRP